ncbi:MAG: MFS transporter [Bacteroidetes bacterium]|nr:MFS transporter [Bacteroidota bacterium]
MSSKNQSSFIALITVFFFWGFVAASNGILIPLFKDKFVLSNFQSQLIDTAFYISYFVGSLLYCGFSLSGSDPINKIGYKSALILGLIISSVGALLFIPAANYESFPMFMIALFIIGFGFAIQQIVANPFVINFGDPSTGSQRLNLAGGINSFGTTIGPVLLSYALFGDINTPEIKSISLNAVISPAIILCVLFLICSAVLFFSSLPNLKNNDKMEAGLGALKFPQLTWGMLAIFIYVGVEVTIQSNMGTLLEMESIKNLPKEKISHYISLYWGSLMIGRWVGALEVFNLKNNTKIILKLIVPLIAFAVIYSVNYLRGSDVSEYMYHLPAIIGVSILFILFGDNPSKTLTILATGAVLMMSIGLLTTGTFALFCFLSGGLFCSVMWPCIFTLAITGLGKYTNQASSLLVMMILGGALIPPLQGYIADLTNPHNAYIVTLFCFAYLALYGIMVKRFYKKQGIANIQNPIVKGH